MPFYSVINLEKSVQDSAGKTITYPNPLVIIYLPCLSADFYIICLKTGQELLNTMKQNNFLFKITTLWPSILKILLNTLNEDYKPISLPFTWNFPNALDACKRLGKGTIYTFVHPENITNFDFEYTFGNNIHNKRFIWTPYHDDIEEGVFRNIYNGKVVEVHWAKGRDKTWIFDLMSHIRLFWDCKVVSCPSINADYPISISGQRSTKWKYCRK